MKKLTYLLGIGFAIAFAWGCDPPDNGTISKTLQPEEFQGILIKEKGVLIDVRSQEEYTGAHISGAVNINVERDDFQAQIDSLDKGTAYFLYCGSGKRSSKAMELMKNAGFTKLYNLEGGISEWRENNFPVIKREELREGDKAN